MKGAQKSKAVYSHYWNLKKEIITQFQPTYLPIVTQSPEKYVAKIKYYD